MIQLIISALSELTDLFLQGMVARRRGRLLNVASTAAFLPGPLQVTYCATKSFVLSFSLSIAEELRDRGITATALRPRPVATEFANASDLTDAGAFKSAATPASVVKVGYDAMQAGRLVAINDWKLAFSLNWIVPLLPRRLVLRLSRQAMEKS